MGQSLSDFENLRTGRIAAATLQINPWSPEDKEVLQALEKMYRGILAINLTHYKAARKEPPLFESIDTLMCLAHTDVILLLLPTIDNVIEHLYKSYTAEGESVNVYKCNYALYALVDKAMDTLLPAALKDEK
jgi:hypothetical protein